MIAGQPGDLVTSQIVLVFAAGTDIRPEDLCTVAAVDYTVETVRSYNRSIQADVRAVE
jgi:hypothetical protein